MAADDVEPEPGPDWSDLPTDVLTAISSHLTLYSDYLRLRSACTSFLSSLPLSPPHPLPPQLPLLLILSPPSLSLLNPVSSRLHSLSLLPPPHRPPPRPRLLPRPPRPPLSLLPRRLSLLPQPPHPRALLPPPPLSSLPHVLSFSPSRVGRELSLLDPTSRRPYAVDLRQMRDDVIKKVILSPSPSSIAVAIVTSPLTGAAELAFCNPADVSWSPVPSSGSFSPEDVIYCGDDNLFYAVNKSGDVLTLNLEDFYREGGVISSKIVRAAVGGITAGDLTYVAKFEEELLLLTRRVEGRVDLAAYAEVYETVGFEVYRFRGAGEGRVGWEAVAGLGGRAVFVGLNSTLGLRAGDLPGCKGDCVYFTDDHSRSNDVGVFDLRSGVIEKLVCHPDGDRGHLMSSPLYSDPTIWFSPNPC